MSQSNLCSKCERRLPPGLRRCFSCGARIYVAESVEEPAGDSVEQTVEPVVAGAGRRGELTEIQRGILLASWRQSRGPIYVCGTDRSNEGEVKSGRERFFGNAALIAVAGLVAPGLIVSVGDDCFTLTDDGAREAVRLDGHPGPGELEARAV